MEGNSCVGHSGHPFGKSECFARSRKVIHVNVTRSPTDAWVARTAARSYGLWANPKYLTHDNDRKFGPCFARVAATSSIKLLNTPYHAPQANECVEYILQSGEVIEDYPQVFPFPAKLLLGRCNGRPIHVVAAENTAANSK